MFTEAEVNWGWSILQRTEGSRGNVNKQTATGEPFTIVIFHYSQANPSGMDGSYWGTTQQSSHHLSTPLSIYTVTATAVAKASFVFFFWFGAICLQVLAPKPERKVNVRVRPQQRYSRKLRGNAQWLTAQNTLCTYTGRLPGVNVCKVRKCEAGCCWKRARLLCVCMFGWTFLDRANTLALRRCLREGEWGDGYEWAWWVKVHRCWKTFYCRLWLCQHS